MNTIETYAGPPMREFLGKGFEPTKEQLAHRIAVLEAVLQALIDRIAEKEGVQLGPMMSASTHGYSFFIYEMPKEKCESSTSPTTS